MFCPPVGEDNPRTLEWLIFRKAALTSVDLVKYEMVRVKDYDIWQW